MEIKTIIFTRITIIIIILFSTILISNTLAEEERAEISILGEPTYELVNEVIKENFVGRTYLINVTLHNAGTIRSDELKVNLTDEEGFSLKIYTYLDPGETKVISFSWSTVRSTDQQLVTNFYPSNLNTEWNQYNSGSKSFTIEIDRKNGSAGKGIPGFEVTLLLIIIIFLIIYKRKIREII